MRDTSEPSPAAVATLLAAEQRIEWVLAHPGFSEWLKRALEGALARDPIDVANDLELLDHLLRAWTLGKIGDLNSR